MARYSSGNTVQRRARSYNKWRGGRTAWVDPFPAVHGTLPEKMVYAKLSQIGVPFLFLNNVTINIPELELIKDYQADFIIPAAKLIIEVQGAHWHSMPKTIEADAYKFALYQMMGYRVVAWWDYEIMSRLDDLVAAEPSLLALATPSTVFRSYELAAVNRTKIDTSKGIRTLNAKRYHAPQVKVSRRRIRKGVSSYAT